jgi:predicted Zn-dependent protease
MRKLKITTLIALMSLFAFACDKQPAANQNSQPAKPANANTSQATKPAGTKKAVQPASSTETGNVYSHPEAGIQFEVPPNWKAEIDGEVMTVSAPDNSISIAFWVPQEADIEAAAEAIDSELAKLMTNIKSTEEAQKGTLNGMEMLTVSGTGEIEGTTINWGANLIDAAKPVYVVAFAAPGLWEQHQTQFAQLVKSIKKAG